MTSEPLVSGVIDERVYAQRIREPESEENIVVKTMTFLGEILRSVNVQ